jgi:hypothetical protein
VKPFTLITILAAALVATVSLKNKEEEGRAARTVTSSRSPVTVVKIEKQDDGRILLQGETGLVAIVNGAPEADLSQTVRFAQGCELPDGARLASEQDPIHPRYQLLVARIN